MMITLDSQQYGTAEAEIMMEGEKHTVEGSERGGMGSAECERKSHRGNSAVSNKNCRMKRARGWRDEAWMDRRRETIVFSIWQQGWKKSTHSSLSLSHTVSPTHTDSKMRSRGAQKKEAQRMKEIKMEEREGEGSLEQQMERWKCWLWPMALILCLCSSAMFSYSENK